MANLAAPQLLCALTKMFTDANSKTVQKFGKTLQNSVPIAYQYNVEYNVKSGSTSVIVCVWTKMSTTDGNSKTVQKFGKTLQNSYL